MLIGFIKENAKRIVLQFRSVFLKMCFSDQWLSITWELAVNADSQMASQAHWLQNSGDRGLLNCVVTNLLEFENHCFLLVKKLQLNLGSMQHWPK